MEIRKPQLFHIGFKTKKFSCGYILHSEEILIGDLENTKNNVKKITTERKPAVSTTSTADHCCDVITSGAKLSSWRVLLAAMDTNHLQLAVGCGSRWRGTCTRRLSSSAHSARFSPSKVSARAKHQSAYTFVSGYDRIVLAIDWSSLMVVKHQIKVPLILELLCRCYGS